MRDHQPSIMKGMTCVSWVLLLTHVVMLPLCGLELSLVVNNFFVQDSGPPLPPPPTTATTTTTTPSHYYRYRDNEISEAYRKYTEEADSYARLNEDGRLYVFVPCVVAAATSLLILTASCWSYVFTTTVSLYTTVGVWMMSLVCILVGQYNLDLSDYDAYPAALWILASQVALLLLLSLQIVLAIWELRRQEASWPTLKLEHLFTWHSIFLAARMTIGVYVAVLICEWGSPLMRGITMKCNYSSWECPHMRYPIWLSLTGVAAAAYSLLVTSEAVFSFVLGISDRPLGCITSIGSGMCNMWVAILASPFFIRAILENSYVAAYHVMPLLVLSTIGSVVTFVHTLAYLFAPRIMQPPSLVKLLADRFRALSFTDLIQKSTLADLCTKVDGVSSKVKASGNFVINFASGVMSLTLIIILAFSWWGHVEDAWGVLLLFAVNIAVLCRVVPALLLYIKFSQDTSVLFAERAVRVGVEGLLSVLGFIGTLACYGPPRTGAIIVGILLVVYSVIQILILANEYSVAKKAAKAPSTDDHQLLKEEESDGESDQTTTTADNRDDVALVA